MGLELQKEDQVHPIKESLRVLKGLTLQDQDSMN